MCSFIGKSVAVFQKKMSFNPQFFVFVFVCVCFLFCPKNMLFKKMVLNWSSLADFKIHHTLEILTKLDFLHFLKVSHFSRLLKFNSSSC